VLGKNVAWPARPQAEISLDEAGVPQIRVTPDSPSMLKELQIFYTQKEPNNVLRTWRDATAVREGDKWIAKLPVLNVSDYVFAFANARYENNIVLSSDFKAVIPSTLGNAIATDKITDVIPWRNNEWTETEPAIAGDGVEGFRAVNKRTGMRNLQISDPAWNAKTNCALSIRFLCTEAQNLFLSANDQFDAKVELKPSVGWQTLVVPSKNLRHRITAQPMQDWTKTSDLLLMPSAGSTSDITKVIFSEFKWVLESP
jgi:hypothetical protein